MRKSLLGTAVLGLVAGCTADRAAPVTAPSIAPSAAAGVATLTAPRARGATSTPVPDRGELLVYDRARKTAHVGAATFHPVILSEQHALNAIGKKKQLLLTSPKGEVIRLEYLQHVEHPGHRWTWIGHDADGAFAALTFSAANVSGTIPQPGDVPLRVGTSDQGVWLATAAPEAMLQDEGAPFSIVSVVDPTAFMPAPTRLGETPIMAAAAVQTRDPVLAPMSDHPSPLPRWSPKAAQSFAVLPDSDAFAPYPVTVPRQADEATINAMIEGNQMVSAKIGTPVFFVRDDMNGDGKSDIVWQDGNSQSLYSNWTSRWYMSGPDLIGGILDNAAIRKVKGIGDFDGDGRGDLLMGYYPVSRHWGYVETWLTDIGGQYRAYPVGDTPPWDWAGIQDMNGDGTSDILWRNYFQGVSRWYMDGAMLIGGAADAMPVGYALVGVGDFDGNGRGDLLWANVHHTFLIMWLTDENGQFQGSYAGIYPAGWNIAGIYDMNGDGTSDIVWRDEQQQQTSRWYMDGPWLIGGAADAIGPEYVLLGIADFDGNGRGDLLWADTARTYLFMWLTDTNGQYQGTYARPYPAGWSLVSGGMRAPFY